MDMLTKNETILLIEKKYSNEEFSIIEQITKKFFN